MPKMAAQVCYETIGMANFWAFCGAFEGELGYFAIAQYASPCAAYFWQRRAGRSSLPRNTAAWPVLLARSCANSTGF